MVNLLQIAVVPGIIGMVCALVTVLIATEEHLDHWIWGSPEYQEWRDG